jgi:purine-binding chemotaxis protein CheW
MARHKNDSPEDIQTVAPEMPLPAAGGAAEAGFGSGRDAHIVIFQSGSGYFAIDIGIVQEIVLMQEITPIPGGASYVAGMTDLRGRVIPVAEFTSLLGIAPSERTDDTRILVVENDGGHIGFIVDAVSEVMMVDGARIEDASSLGTREHDFIVGVAKLEEHLVSLVDVPRLLLAADRGVAVAA